MSDTGLIAIACGLIIGLGAIGACLGIPGITAHRAVFEDGPITGALSMNSLPPASI